MLWSLPARPVPLRGWLSYTRTTRGGGAGGRSPVQPLPEVALAHCGAVRPNVVVPSTRGGTQRVQSVRGEGRGVSDQYEGRGGGGTFTARARCSPAHAPAPAGAALPRETARSGRQLRTNRPSDRAPPLRPWARAHLRVDAHPVVPRVARPLRAQLVVPEAPPQHPPEPRKEAGAEEPCGVQIHVLVAVVVPARAPALRSPRRRARARARRPSPLSESAGQLHSRRRQDFRAQIVSKHRSVVTPLGPFGFRLRIQVQVSVQGLDQEETQ
jgi:hypothetical protein